MKLKPNKKNYWYVLIFLLSFLFGCAESRINSVTTDSPYLDSEKPVLVIKNEHFGGGYTIEGTGKRAFFAGGELFNYGARSAYSVNIRVRIYDANLAACDDHMIYLGDISPAKSASFDEKYEVISTYKDSEIILTYQDDSKINTMVLKPSTQNINDLDKNSY